MYWISVSALGTLYYLYLKGKKRSSPDLAEPPAMAEGAGTPEEKSRPPKTPESQDPVEAFKAMDQAKDPWERHTIYARSIELAYRERKSDPAMQDRVIEYGTLYMNEFAHLKQAVAQALGEDALRNPVFKQLAITLEEKDLLDKAVNVCMNAITHELKDGTKTGYEGRMERIRKKMEKDR